MCRAPNWGVLAIAAKSCQMNSIRFVCVLRRSQPHFGRRAYGAGAAGQRARRKKKRTYLSIDFFVLSIYFFYDKGIRQKSAALGLDIASVREVKRLASLPRCVHRAVP
jgi:hypothetical protein